MTDIDDAGRTQESVNTQAECESLQPASHSLIGKLLELREECDDSNRAQHSHIVLQNNMLEACIAIIRQHQQASADVVDILKSALGALCACRHISPIDGALVDAEITKLKAAIAAFMGGDTRSPQCRESITQNHLADDPPASNAHDTNGASIPEPTEKQVIHSEIRLLSFSDIEEELTKHSKYLHNPLSDNEKALIGDILRLLKPQRAMMPVSVKAIADKLEIWSGDVKSVLDAAEVAHVD